MTSGTGKTHRFRGAILVSLALVAAGCVSTPGAGTSDASGTDIDSVAPDSVATDASPDSTEPGAADPATPVPRRSERVIPDSPGLAITITRVIDGDSVEATSAEGNLEIRLIGLNAPEGTECFGPEAADVLREATDSGPVAIHPWPPELDDFGRQLGFLVADDTFVNLALLEQGAAIARAQGDHEFAEEFEAAELSAETSGAGLWGACTSTTGASVFISDSEANAPGDDRENPNGEWILLTNDGDADVALNGWGVRDESTRHRFTFGDVTLPAGSSLRLRTGCGSNDISVEPFEIFWCNPEPPVWNNDGDRAFLLDPSGATVDSVPVGG